jgi:hypothetical protein
MVDQIPTSPKLIDLSEWRASKASRNTGSSPDSSDDQRLQEIAKGIFDGMTQAAKALVRNDSPGLVRNDSPGNVQKLEQAANYLLHLEMPLADKFVILDYLCGLSPKRSALPSGNDRIINPKQEADLYIVNQLSALRTQLEFLSCQDEEPSLHELHRAPSEGHPVWSEQLFALLTKTAIPKSGRVRIYDDLAGLYSHHLNMFELHTQQEPFWDIVQMATFVLDIADEEFRQEQEYEKAELVKARQPRMPQSEITLEDLKPVSLDLFRQRRLLRERYSDDSGIILRNDFKANFLQWMDNNLEDLHQEGLSGSHEKVFNTLCASAKAGQALRLSREQI